MVIVYRIEIAVLFDGWKILLIVTCCLLVEVENAMIENRWWLLVLV